MEEDCLHPGEIKGLNFFVLLLVWKADMCLHIRRQLGTLNAVMNKEAINNIFFSMDKIFLLVMP